MDDQRSALPEARRSILVYLVPFVLINSLLYSVAKDSLNYSQPFIFMSIRFALISVVYLVLFRRSITSPSRGMVLIGIFSSVSGSAWLLGLNYVSSADSAVLSYTMPFFAMPLSYYLLKERIHTANLLGALIGIAGVLVYSETLPKSGDTALGILLTMMNAFFFALFTVYYRKMRESQVGNILFWQSFVSFLFFLPLSFVYPRFDWTVQLQWDILYVVIFGGVIMFYAWNMMSRQEGIGRLAALVYLVPGMAILYQTIQSGQLPSPIAVLGTVVMIFGVYVSRFYGASSSQKPAQR